MILAGVLLDLTWRYAISHSLVNDELTAQQKKYISIRHYITPFVFLLSISVEFLFAPSFLGPYVLLAIPVLIFILDRIFAKSLPKLSNKLGLAKELLWRAGTFLPWLLVFVIAVWATIH